MGNLLKTGLFVKSSLGGQEAGNPRSLSPPSCATKPRSWIPLDISGHFLILLPLSQCWGYLNYLPLRAVTSVSSERLNLQSCTKLERCPKRGWMCIYIWEGISYLLHLKMKLDEFSISSSSIKEVVWSLVAPSNFNNHFPLVQPPDTLSISCNRPLPASSTYPMQKFWNSHGPCPLSISYPVSTWNVISHFLPLLHFLEGKRWMIIYPQKLIILSHAQTCLNSSSKRTIPRLSPLECHLWQHCNF